MREQQGENESCREELRHMHGPFVNKREENKKKWSSVGEYAPASSKDWTQGACVLAVSECVASHVGFPHAFECPQTSYMSLTAKVSPRRWPVSAPLYTHCFTKPLDRLVFMLCEGTCVREVQQQVCA